jgi:hypothetical protein
MAFYPPNPGRGPFPPRYRQNVGPPGSFGRQGNPYPPPAPPRRQGNPFFYPNQMGGQGNPSFYPNQFGDQGQSFYNQNQFGMQNPAAYNPNQQFGGSGFGRLPGQLNRIMGHVGTVTNGVNMLRQLGSFMTLFR